MDDLENKLGAILGNPKMMQQIMSLAQNLQQENPSAPESKPANNHSSEQGDLDLSVLQKLSGLSRQSRIDPNQQSLLNALRPYLSRQRLQKLEQAMRAAKMAGIATSFMNQAGR